MTERIEIDLSTGEEVRVALTPAETAALMERLAANAEHELAVIQARQQHRADVAIVRDETKGMQERFRALLRLLRDRLDDDPE